jgi:hypothetical protein
VKRRKRPVSPVDGARVAIRHLADREAIREVAVDLHLPDA